MNTAKPLMARTLQTPPVQTFQRLVSAGLILGAMACWLPSTPAAAQSPSQTRAADYIVAVVNSEPITNNDVQLLKLRIERQLPPGAPKPDPKT